MELLFESRLNIGALDGKMVFVQNKPAVRQDPVLCGDSFCDGAGASIYGSVLHDGGIWRMWYQAWPKNWDGHDIALVGYAESDDGITWRKPTLDLFAFGDGPNNLTDLGVHSPSVFIDPAAPSSHRYRATGFAHPGYQGAMAGVASRGYFTAHSADGLHWTADAPRPTWSGSDVITSVYHPGRGAALTAIKYNPRYRAIPRRSIWQAELADGTWSPARRALVPDDFDDVAAMARGFASADYYGMAMQPAARGTVGFVWQFRHTLPRTGHPGWENGVFGTVAVSLAYQEDAGACWQHAPGRPDFFSSDALPWAPGGVYTSSAPVECGDEHRLYLCGALHTHGWYVDHHWQIQERWKQQIIEDGMARITYASWPKWRLFGYRADPVGTVVLNVGPVAQPSRLVLNVGCERGGSVRAELPGVEGRSVEASVPIASDTTGTVAAWQDGDVITPAGDAPVAVKLHLERATVWAYELQAV
jgi:hypothetical protein